MPRGRITSWMASSGSTNNWLDSDGTSTTTEVLRAEASMRAAGLAT